MSIAYNDSFYHNVIFHGTALKGSYCLLEKRHLDRENAYDREQVQCFWQCVPRTGFHSVMWALAVGTLLLWAEGYNENFLGVKHVGVLGTVFCTLVTVLTFMASGLSGGLSPAAGKHLQ